MLSKINNLSFGKFVSNNITRENSQDSNNKNVLVKQKADGTTITREFYQSGKIKTYTTEYPTGDAYIEEYDEDGDITSATIRFPSGDKLERSYKK